MKFNFIKKSLSILALSIAIVSCDNDDKTGDSLLVPTTPTVSINFDFPNPNIVLEDDTEYPFTVTLSEAQIVDTRLHLSQVGGTASSNDYEMTPVVVIPAGYTTAGGKIKILADELAEDVETLTIQVGDQRTTNSAMTPATASFTISNATSDDLVIGLNWAPSDTVYDDAGEEISATTYADLRLVLTDPFINELANSDGGGFETYELSGLAPNGEYYLVADFYSVMDISRNIDLTMTYDQLGVINGGSLSFPGALDSNSASCQKFIMAKVTKTGNSYTVEEVGTNHNSPGVPADDLYIGQYASVTTSPGQFGNAFNQTLTLVDEGNGIRSFEGNWRGFSTRTYKFRFNPACGTVTLYGENDTNVSCGIGIVHGPSASGGAPYDLDDSSLVITFTENINSDCGGVPTDVTITLTKI